MKRFWLIALIAALLFGAYKGYDYTTRHSETTLLARAHDYWEAVRINDLVTAYHLEAEAENGQLAPDEVELRHEWNMRVVGYQLGKVTYYGNHAEIEVSLEHTLPDTKTGKTTKSKGKDLWTFLNGQWYHGAPEKGAAGIRKR